MTSVFANKKFKLFKNGTIKLTVFLEKRRRVNVANNQGFVIKNVYSKFHVVNVVIRFVIQSASANKLPDKHLLLSFTSYIRGSYCCFAI